MPNMRASNEDGTTLHTRVQINGGNDAPADNSLMERELFISLNTGKLYFGINNNGNLEVREVTVSEAEGLDTGFMKATKYEVTIGEDNQKCRITITADGINGNNETHCSGLIFDNIILSTECYGKKEPENPQPGQLFFFVGEE